MSVMAILQTVADTAQVKCSEQLGGGSNCQTNLPLVQANGTAVQTILQLVFGTLGALAVLIIVIGAIQMALSEGDPQKLSKSRQTVIYALVGLVVALLAEAVVIFVLRKL